MLKFNSPEIPENYSIVIVSNDKEIFIAHTDKVDCKTITRVITSILLFVPRDERKDILENALEKSLCLSSETYN